MATTCPPTCSPTVLRWLAGPANVREKSLLKDAIIRFVAVCHFSCPQLCMNASQSDFCMGLPHEPLFSQSRSLGEQYDAHFARLR
jgi:hypothetical protein